MSSGYGRGGSCSDGWGFEYRHHKLDGHFPHLIVVQIEMFVWKDKNKLERLPGMALFKIKLSLSIDKLVFPCLEGGLKPILFPLHFFPEKIRSLKFSKCAFLIVMVNHSPPAAAARFWTLAVVDVIKLILEEIWII